MTYIQLGNLLIIGTVIYNKDLHSSTNILLVNLSIADLFISLIVEPFTIVGKYLKNILKFFKKLFIHS